MSKPISGRRIKVDVQLSGGRIKLDLTEPTDGQLQRITALLEEWLDEEDEEEEEVPPAAEAPTPPAPSERGCPQRSAHASHLWMRGAERFRCSGEGQTVLPAAKRALCGVLDGVTGHRCRRYTGHTDDRHGWWGKGADSHTWTDTIAEPPAQGRFVVEHPPLTQKPHQPIEPEPSPKHTLPDTQARRRREALERYEADQKPTEKPGCACGVEEPHGPHEGDAVALQLGDEAPLADQITEHAATAERAPTPPGVHLCRCGHAERLHELDGTDRGVCSRRVCGCAEYRAA